MAALDRLITWLARIAAGVIAAMVISIAYEVVSRYVFGKPSTWVNEFSEYALVYVAFLAGAFVLRQEGHVRVELLTERLSPRVRRGCHIVTSLVGAATCATIAWVSTQYVWRLYESGEFMFRTVQVQKWLLIAVIPLGMTLLAIEFVRRALRPPAASDANF